MLLSALLNKYILSSSLFFLVFSIIIDIHLIYYYFSDFGQMKLK